MKPETIEPAADARHSMPRFVRWVVCAANRHKTRGIIICGARHWDEVMRGQVEAMGEDYHSWDQGFIDQRGEWMTREEAHEVAKENGQIRRRCGGDAKRLFSENLY
jgi:hypothetical protein